MKKNNINKILKSLVVIFLISSSGLIAQNHTEAFEQKLDKANGYINNEQFDEALPLYLELNRMDSLNSDINFAIGVCYFNSRTEKSKAIKYLEKAIECTSVNTEFACTEKQDKAHLNVFKFLGDAYHIEYRFDMAIASYERYKMLVTKKRDQAMINEVNLKIEMCNVGKELLTSPVKVKIENMGTTINSPFADYCPVLSADETTMIFTTRRPETTGGKVDEWGSYFEDIYISHKVDAVWSKAVSIGGPINTDGNEASVGISVDGQTILVYKDDNGDGNLYSTSLDGDQWSTPIKLNANINTEGWEPSAFISADGNTLYFTSNREGGYGGRDLYQSKKLPTGEWAKATNLGPNINTPYEEDAPFIHPDGVTLYFSSNGHRTMGGFDIFSTRLNDKNEWTIPQNVGYPINSTDDDIYYVVSPDNKRAYYSSFKQGGIGEKDNYMVTFAEYKDPGLTLLKGVITDAYKKVPKVVDIYVSDNETGELVGIYHSNSKTGEYLFILPPGRNYNIAYEADGYLFHSDNMDLALNTNYYVIHKAIKLQPLVVGSKIVLNNIFFDFDKATLRTTSNLELAKLNKLLNKYPNMVVEISGHTDSKGSPKYNIKLSEKRASAVVKYLIAKGISKNQMTSKGYGESQPFAVNINTDGSDNPVNRQLNRRVELKIIAIN